MQTSDQDNHAVASAKASRSPDPLGTNPYPGFLLSLLGDGRPGLMFTGLCLVLWGGFALFLSISAQFLPHDVQYLGMTAEALCSRNQCRIVHFMLHDRAAFGGAIIAIGALYLWLAEFPMRAREPWAWWTFGLSGVVGFGSFLAYLGYGYLDKWHLVGTLAMLPTFLAGMALTWRGLRGPRSWRALVTPSAPLQLRTPGGIGRALLLLTGLGVIGGGLTIMTVGMTTVFVPQDLSFMGVTRAELDAISDRLVPLIAHDRAGFGGALASTGIALLLSVWCGRPSRALWEALAISGGFGFGCAIGVHYVVGYEDFIHLLPAHLGALVFVAGMALSWRSMFANNEAPSHCDKVRA